jgi:hypothetical protein
MAAAVFVVVMMRGPHAVRRCAVVASRRYLLEVSCGACDELLELTTVEPDTTTARANIDDDPVALAFVQRLGLTAGAMHGAFLSREWRLRDADLVFEPCASCRQL